MSNTDADVMMEEGFFNSMATTLPLTDASRRASLMELARLSSFSVPCRWWFLISYALSRCCCAPSRSLSLSLHSAMPSCAWQCLGCFWWKAVWAELG